MPRRVFFFKVALRYRYKRDLRKGPRVTPSFALCWAADVLHYMYLINKNQVKTRHFTHTR